MQLHGAIDHPLRRLGRKHFRDCRLARHARGALVFGPGGAIDEQGGGVDLACAVGDCGLRELQFGERRAEELAAGCAFHGFMQRAAREAKRGGTHGRTEHVEGRHGDLETVPRPAQAIGERHANAFEPQRGQRMRRDHLDAFGHAQSGRIGVDQEGGEALGAGPLAGAREYHVMIGDPAV